MDIHRHSSVPAETAPRAPVLRSLLVPVPPSGLPQRLIERMARLPVAPGATMTLVHVRSRFGSANVEAHLADAARRLASFLPMVKMDRVLTSGPTLAALRALARTTDADLLVIGSADRPLHKLAAGTKAMRIVRHAGCPVLVVGGEVTSTYQRPLVAVDLDDSARAVLTFARRVLPAPHPPITVVHAYEVPFEGLLHPDSADTHREYYRRRAEGALIELIANLRATDGQWSRHLQYGEPRLVISTLIARTCADLVVVGTHARSIVISALLGSVAADVVRRARCDVLVVPPHARR